MEIKIHNIIHIEYAGTFKFAKRIYFSGPNTTYLINYKTKKRMGVNRLGRLYNIWL